VPYKEHVVDTSNVWDNKSTEKATICRASNGSFSCKTQVKTDTTMLRAHNATIHNIFTNIFLKFCPVSPVLLSLTAGCARRCTVTRLRLSEASQLRNPSQRKSHRYFMRAQLRRRFEDSEKQHLLLQKYFRYDATLEYSVVLGAMLRERFETPHPRGQGCTGRFLRCQQWGLVVSEPVTTS
jgi:hypothetical protein